MSRYTGPKCKNCRRYGMNLCQKPAGRCAWEKRNSPPGDRGSRQRRRVSEYGVQLREKQKTMSIYGMRERQFRRFYNEAVRREGITGDELLHLLESRLDNVVFRLGFAGTRPQARQSVNHGHFEINGKRVDIPSYLVKPDDVISWRESSKKKVLYEVVQSGISEARPPSWLNLNKKSLTGKVLTTPVLGQREMGIDTRLIVEYYSRR